MHTILIVVAVVLLAAAAALSPSTQRDRLVYIGLATLAISFLFWGR